MSLEAGGGFTRRVEEDAKKAALAAVHGPGHVPTPEAPKPSLEDILNDSEKSARFDHYLASLKKMPKTPAGKDPRETLLKSRSIHGAWARYNEGNHTPADITLIKNNYDEYLARLKSFNDLHEGIKGSMADLLQYSPQFKSSIEFNGKENIEHVLREGLRDLALAKPAEFAAIQAQLAGLETQRREEARLDKTISDFMKQNSITDDAEMRVAMSQPHQADRSLAVEKLLRKQLDWSSKMIDWVQGAFGGGSFAKAESIAGVDVLAHVGGRKAAFDAAGQYLSTLLVKNKDMREGLSRLQRGEEIAMIHGSEGRLPFIEARTEGKEGFTKEAVLNRAKEYKKTHAADFTKMRAERNPARRDAMLHDLRTEFGLEEKVRTAEYKTRGFFASIFAFLFEPFNPAGNKDAEDILK